MRSRLPFLLFLVAIGACADGTGPALRTGLHRFTLQSVNGHAVPYVPPPSTGGYMAAVAGGELLLKPDGSFSHGIDAWLGGVVTGTYDVQGTTLLLRFGEGTDRSQAARLSGDSLIVERPTIGGGDVPGTPAENPLRYVYRRTTPPADVAPRVFVLAEVNGQPEPFVLYDVTTSSGRSVATVVYDTVRLIDGLFFERARDWSGTLTLPDGTVLASGEQYRIGGSYAEGDGRVVLRSYVDLTGFQGWRKLDTLAVSGTALVRTSPGPPAPVVERYAQR